MSFFIFQFPELYIQQLLYCYISKFVKKMANIFRRGADRLCISRKAYSTDALVKNKAAPPPDVGLISGIPEQQLSRRVFMYIYLSCIPPHFIFVFFHY